MSILFSASEVVTMAIEIEKNGMDFYNALASRVDDEKSQELYRFLAGEEVKHKATFQKMLNNLKKVELTAADEEEYNHYLKALTNSRVFRTNQSADELLDDLKDEAGAIEFAINAEKDSILFYYELLEQAFDEDRDSIENVIKEEKVHLAKLLTLRSEL